MYPEAISKTPDGTTATVGRAQNVSAEAAREGIQKQTKKIKSTSSKKFPKTYSRAKCQNNNTRYWQSKGGSKINNSTDIKDEEFLWTCYWVG